MAGLFYLIYPKSWSKEGDHRMTFAMSVPAAVLFLAGVVVMICFTIARFGFLSVFPHDFFHAYGLNDVFSVPEVPTNSRP
jgi:hypothetical protein